MTTRRSLKNRVAKLEDAGEPDDIHLFLVTFATDGPHGPDADESPIVTAMKADRRVNRRSPGGFELLTESDREDFRRRLETALDRLAEADGIDLEPDAFLELATDLFADGDAEEADATGRADVTVEQVNQVWGWTVGQIPDPDDPMDQRPRVVNRAIDEAD